ncbi:MAG: hypothetical protein E7374_00270 [Clostridiales bacterium]|nr:hypothetical protein [Clostridiales bacterium]
MLKALSNKLLLVLYYVLSALLLELITFRFLEFGVVPEYFLYNFSIILMLAMVVYLVPNYLAQYIIYSLLILVQVFLIYVNYSLLMIYGDMFSIDMIRLLKEATLAMTSNFLYFTIILQLIAIAIALILCGFLVYKFVAKEKISVKKHYSVFVVFLMIAVQCFSLAGYFQVRGKVKSEALITDENYINSDSFLMNTIFLKTQSYQKFGTFGYFANLIVNQVNWENEVMEQTTIKYFENGSMYGTAGNRNEDVFGVDKGNNVIVVMMESLEWFGFSDGTHDPTFENMSPEIAPNIYALMYGDDYESDTTNSNQGNDSLRLKNFYAKSKTNISEGFGIIGSYPVGRSMTDVLNNRDETTMGFAMPNMLNRLGYTTSYIHSNEITFYNRNKTHEKLGFDVVVGKDGIKDENGDHVYTGNELKWNRWDAEGKFAENAIDYIVPKNYNENPFYSFYLNVSSHGSYKMKDNKYDGDVIKYYDLLKYGEDDCVINKKGNYELDEDKDKDDLTYTEFYQRLLDNYGDEYNGFCDELLIYYCGVKGLDDAIGVIVNQLKEYGIEDKTTICLFSDHYAYYDQLTNIFKGLDLGDVSSRDVNTIPCIISSPGLKNYNTSVMSDNTKTKYIVNDRFTSAYDIIPTLLELLGVPFNENFYVGHSLFRPADYVYEHNGEWYDMTIYYSNTGGVFSNHVHTYDFKNYIKDEEVDDEVVEMFRAEVKNALIKVNYLDLLNRYDLFKKLTKI